MLKKTVAWLLYLFIPICLSAQTSIRAELNEKINPRDYYRLKTGQASEIKVTVTTDPAFPDSPEYSYEKWEYQFVSADSISGTAQKDGKTVYTFQFSIDKQGRKIKSTDRIPNLIKGWETTRIAYEYQKNLKRMFVAGLDGKTQYLIEVAYDSLQHPLYVASASPNGITKAIALADYFYDDRYYTQTLYNDMGKVLLEESQYFYQDYIIKKNEQGDVIEMYEPFEPIIFGVVFYIKYRYDKRGNWTRKTITIKTPEDKWVRTLIKRRIKYIK